MHVIDSPKTGELVTAHELEASAMNRLNLYVEHEPGLVFAPKVMVVHGAPAEKILEVAEKEAAELIILGVRKNSDTLRATHFQGAVAHQVLSQATCPVLTVRS
jgi:nucleotide-binding universal stress UspA family protein